MTHGLGPRKPGPRATKPITPPYVENNYRTEVKITFILIAYLVLLCEFFWLLLNCFASIPFFVTYWEKTFDRPRKYVCQVRPFSHFSRRHEGYPSAPAILQKPSRGSVVSRPLTVNQVNSRRFIDWFSCCVQGLCSRLTKVWSRCSLD